MLAYSSREVRAALRMLRLSLTRNPLISVPLLKVLPVLHPVFQGSDGPVAVKRSTPKGDSSDHSHFPESAAITRPEASRETRRNVDDCGPHVGFRRGQHQRP